MVFDRKTWTKNYKMKNREKINAQRRSVWKRTYARDKERISAYHARLYQKNKTRYALRNKKYYEATKLKVLQHYSNALIPLCACCGETIYEFLTLDHINGGGQKERKEKSKFPYARLIRENYPKHLRVLCWNCNSGRRNGECPHKKKERTSRMFG